MTTFGAFGSPSAISPSGPGTISSPLLVGGRGWRRASRRAPAVGPADEVIERRPPRRRRLPATMISHCRDLNATWCSSIREVATTRRRNLPQVRRTAQQIMAFLCRCPVRGGARQARPRPSRSSAARRPSSATVAMVRGKPASASAPSGCAPLPPPAARRHRALDDPQLADRAVAEEGVDPLDDLAGLVLDRWRADRRPAARAAPAPAPSRRLAARPDDLLRPRAVGVARRRQCPATPRSGRRWRSPRRRGHRGQDLADEFGEHHRSASRFVE